MTGSKQTPISRLKNMVADLKKMSDLPVAIGFGIRSSSDVRATKEYADGAIIGTAIVNLCANYGGHELQSKITELFN